VAGVPLPTSTSGAPPGSRFGVSCRHVVLRTPGWGGDGHREGEKSVLVAQIVRDRVRRGCAGQGRVRDGARCIGLVRIDLAGTH